MVSNITMVLLDNEVVQYDGIKNWEIKKGAIVLQMGSVITGFPLSNIQSFRIEQVEE